MLKVVVDTNIWVSTLIKPHGYDARMIAEILRRGGEIFTTEEILAESREVALRPRIKDKYHLTEDTVDQALAEVRLLTTIVHELPELKVIKEDPDDNVILACALQAAADYLLSYDPHLTNLSEYQGIRILTPRQFIAILKQEHREEPS